MEVPAYNYDKKRSAVYTQSFPRHSSSQMTRTHTHTQPPMSSHMFSTPQPHTQTYNCSHTVAVKSPPGLEARPNIHTQTYPTYTHTHTDIPKTRRGATQYIQPAHTQAKPTLAQSSPNSPTSTRTPQVTALTSPQSPVAAHMQLYSSVNVQTEVDRRVMGSAYSFSTASHNDMHPQNRNSETLSLSHGHSRNSFDTLTSNEDDFHTKPLVIENSTIFIGNIPPAVTEERFLEVLSAEGSIDSFEYYPRAGCWSAAIVTFSSISQATVAVSFLHGKRAFKNMPHHKVVACFAPTPQTQCPTNAELRGKSQSVVLLRDGPPGANLFVYGIPSDWTEVTLMDLCQQFGHIVGIRVPAAVSGPQRLNRGFGFVSYDSQDCAFKALAALSGVRLLGKPLKLQLKTGEERLCPRELLQYAEKPRPKTAVKSLGSLGLCTRFSQSYVSEVSTSHIPPPPTYSENTSRLSSTSMDAENTNTQTAESEVATQSCESISETAPSECGGGMTTIVNPSGLDSKSVYETPLSVCDDPTSANLRHQHGQTPKINPDPSILDYVSNRLHEIQPILQSVISYLLFPPQSVETDINNKDTTELLRNVQNNATFNLYPKWLKDAIRAKVWDAEINALLAFATNTDSPCGTKTEQVKLLLNGHDVCEANSTENNVCHNLVQSQNSKSPTKSHSLKINDTICRAPTNHSTDGGAYDESFFWNNYNNNNVIRDATDCSNVSATTQNFHPFASPRSADIPHSNFELRPNFSPEEGNSSIGDLEDIMKYISNDKLHQLPNVTNNSRDHSDNYYGDVPAFMSHSSLPDNAFASDHPTAFGYVTDAGNGNTNNPFGPKEWRNLYDFLQFGLDSAAS